MREIAVTGKDGCGKTAVIQEAILLLKQSGINAGYVDVPRFTHFGALGRFNRWVLARTESSSKLLFLMSGGLYLTTYLIARALSRKHALIFTEHHPRLELEAHAKASGGRIGGLVGIVLEAFMPKPFAAVLVDVTVEIALERIAKRGRPIQHHETREGLSQLSEVIKSKVARQEINITVDNNKDLHAAADFLTSFVLRVNKMHGPK